MRLIVEQIERPEFVTEANAHGDKDWYICGKYIIGEEKNKNGRLYPINVLEDSVQKYITEKVNEGLAYGELGHPNGPTVNLDRSSHRILSLQQKGNVFEGKSIITNTPHGNTAKGLLESGGKLGVSTRGMGSLQEKNGAMEVQKDFRLSSVDIVADPSGPGCFVNGLMEGVEYFFDKGTWREERIEELAKQAKRMTKEEREAKALTLFEAYFRIIAEGDVIPFRKSKSGMSSKEFTNKWKGNTHDNPKWNPKPESKPKESDNNYRNLKAKFHAMSQGDDFEGGNKNKKKK